MICNHEWYQGKCVHCLMTPYKAEEYKLTCEENTKLHNQIARQNKVIDAAIEWRFAHSDSTKMIRANLELMKAVDAHQKESEE